jgi:hypothetical protein
MIEMDRTRAIEQPPTSWRTAQRFAAPNELWCFRGAKADLRGLVIHTSFGDAFGLELAGELILLFLQPSRERLIAYAERVKAVLLKQGWRVIAESVTATHLGQEDA